MKTSFMSKKILISALVFACLFFCSCIIPEDRDKTDSQSGASEILWSDYIIVRAPGEVPAASADELRDAIKRNFGVDIRVCDDGEKTGTGAEILIGQTSRAMSGEVFGELEANSYAVKRSGDAIVIVGTNDYLTREAVSYFIERYVVPGEEPAGDMSYRSGSKTPLYLVKDSKAVSRIIYCAGGGETAITAARSIHDKIKSLTGVSIGIYSSAGVPDNGETEILVGMTDRTESAGALGGMGYGKYVICTVGNKLAVNAYDEDALTLAVIELCGILDSMVPMGGRLSVFADMRVEGIHNAALSVLPAADGTEFSGIYYNGDGSYVVTLTDVTVEEYYGYNNKLESVGFEQYADNEINGNLFFTFTGESYTVTNIYIKYDAKIKIISEPAGELPDNEGDRVTTGGVATLVTQIGLEVPNNTADYQNGMSYVIRLCDGSFIIIDGGHNRAANATNLYKIMRNQAPDVNNIVVAAWIFTHAHTDHTGAFRQFNAYAKYVKVEKFIFNFTDEKKPETGNLMVEYITGIKKEISANFPDAKVYKAHAGQVYRIRNAEVEILYSLELLTPADLSNYNRTSLMFTINIEGEKLMFLGDCTVESSALMCLLYGNTLKSDFVQVGHHGYSGGSTELYTLINPTYVLWPLAEHTYTTSHRNAPRNAFFRISEKIKQICVAGDSIWVVELTAGQVKFSKYNTVNDYLSN